MNSITDLLDLEDTDITITDIQIQGQTIALKGSGFRQTLKFAPHKRPS